MILKVLGKNVKVVFTDLEAENLYGRFWIEANVIEIDKKLKKEQKTATILHELIHAVIQRSGLNNVIAPDTEEIVCDQIAKVIAENFHLKKK